MRLLKGAWDVWKPSWQLACGVLFPARHRARGNPHGGATCGWMRYLSHGSKLAIPCGSSTNTHAAQTTERARVVRGLGHVSSRKQPVTGSGSLKHRTGGRRCQTSVLADEPEPNYRTLEQVKEIEDGKALERDGGLLFRGSTNPVAKERLFL
jgi:hypothetical protein